MNRMLCEDYLELASSPDPENVYTGSPSICRMRSGRLLASYEVVSRQTLEGSGTGFRPRVLVSDDDGATWTLAACQDFIWATVWTYEDEAYLIGNRRKSRDIVIGRSRDGGFTWEGPVTLFEGKHHCAPTPVLIHNGYAYRAFETCDAPSRFDWKSLVVAGDLSKDLLDPGGLAHVQPRQFPRHPRRTLAKEIPGKSAEQGAGPTVSSREISCW